MNIKSYTDLEQSKALAKILPIESADMCYKVNRHNNESKIFMIPYSELGYYKDNDYQYSVCAWSLAALINVLPESIASNDGFAFKLNIKKNIIEYSNPSLYLIYKSVESDNLIDCCVEMILRLHELKVL